MTIIFNDRKISSGYAIAKLVNDDSRPYDHNDDSCLYLAENKVASEWADFEDAKIFPNEATLAAGLENAQSRNPTNSAIFPIYTQTTITTVDNKAFDKHVLQVKRAKAMAKLDAEDLVVLGLMGAPE